MLLLFLFGTLYAKENPVRYTPEDSLIYLRLLEQGEAWRTKPAGEQLYQAARFFLHTPYVSGTLEGEPERLTVNLRQLDCTTLVEQALALVGAVRKTLDFPGYCAMLQRIRYRNPDSVSYTERLHYLTDWAYENELRGYVKDVTQTCGGTLWPLNLHFMTDKRALYPALTGRLDRINELLQVEKTVNARTHFYIPKNEIGHCAGAFRTGDIVGFVTTVRGLDVSHIGILCWIGGRLTFIHASSKQKEVVIHAGTLEQYIVGQKNLKGIMLLRPQLF